MVDVTSTDFARLFPWLTRNRMGPRVGSRPSGWYQQHQIKALELIVTRCRERGYDPTRVRVRFGVVEAPRVHGTVWLQIAVCSDVFDAADKAIRKVGDSAEVQQD